MSLAKAWQKAKGRVSEDGLSWLRDKFPMAVPHVEVAAEDTPAQRLAQRTRAWQLKIGDDRIPRRDRPDAEEDRLAKQWSDMMRLHLMNALSESDVEVLRQVPGGLWDEFSLSPAARLARGHLFFSHQAVGPRSESARGTR